MDIGLIEMKKKHRSDLGLVKLTILMVKWSTRH